MLLCLTGREATTLRYMRSVRGLASAAAVLAACLLVGGALVAAMGTKTIRDRRGDTKAADLDIVSATVSVSGTLVRVQLKLAAAIRDDAIYSTMLECSGKTWQLAAKKAAGDKTLFLFSVDSYKHTSARQS
ncbi:MAG TPA: hypothetical protein VJZ25_05170 [Gemmatimonadaceae bacterium]|nr:hypothetical protein [Gemmatimonadaceae bacterium]